MIVKVALDRYVARVAPWKPQLESL